ncbi:zinc finger protein 543-like isoform X1 [Neoarius graeffei]|uniref:zinc finger protein 543-like isoform X1 n=1 Tax=Neoarius graeffei TaxID=443677 RepID=UPI00298CA7F5|nr:zinc finger protein 543-like isoform X1 [Neoarius graeffei]
MQQSHFQDMEDIPGLNSEGLWCNIKMCEVKLVDIRKTQGLNSKIILGENLPPGDKSSRSDGDQQTLHAQLKIGLVKKMDCGKIQSSNATAEGEPEDRVYDDPGKSRRFDGDQQTLLSELKMSSVRLVDCRKMQNRKATADAEPDHESKNTDFAPSRKTIRFDGDQKTLEAQLKVCLVRLVDCVKIQSRKGTAEGEPEDGAYHKSYNSNFIPSSESSQSSSTKEHESASQEKMIKRKSPRNVKFVKNICASPLSSKHIVLWKGQTVYQCSQCSKSFSSSLDFGRHQNVHGVEKLYQCAQCGKEFSQRSQLRSHQCVHAGKKPYQCT